MIAEVEFLEIWLCSVVKWLVIRRSEAFELGTGDVKMGFEQAGRLVLEIEKAGSDFVELEKVLLCIGVTGG